MHRRHFIKNIATGGAGLICSRLINPFKVFADPIISGIITDVLSEEPIVNTLVEILDGNNIIDSSYTGNDGFYELDLDLSVLNQIYPVSENLYGDIEIVNILGQQVGRFKGSLQDVLTFDFRNAFGSRLSTGIYLFKIKNSKEIISGKLLKLEGSVMNQVEVISKIALDSKSGRNINFTDDVYTLRISHDDYFLFEEEVDITGNTTIDLPIIPLTFDMNFFYEVCCHAQSPDYIPLHPIRRWMTNPQIYFNPNYPAPDQNYQNIVENVILNDLPNFTNGAVVPEIVTLYPNEYRLQISFVPQSMLPYGAGGVHGEWLENPLNPNEITKGSVQLGNFINYANSRRSIALHELSQCLINGSDTEIYNTSVFAGYGPSIINYLPQDLDLGKIEYSYPAGTWL